MSEVRSTFQLHPGDRIPKFSLPDAYGVRHDRDGLIGRSGLLVVFACNHCPYVVHLADSLGQVAAEFHQIGIATVAINSNDIETYPQDGPEEMKKFVVSHHWNFAYLLDESQDVARAFGAACTPDFFLCNGSGELVYAGQFDQTRPRSGHQADGADIRLAARRMLAGEPMTDVMPSSGCNIKWKPGKQPEWWNRG